MDTDTLAALQSGRIEVVGRIVGASNVCLLVEVSLPAGAATKAIYKPVSGERPLWDFPDGTLAGREVAAYLVSAQAGWGVVPPTVLREDGPFGPGSLQAWIETEDDEPGAHLVDIFAPGAVPDGWLHVLSADGVDDQPIVLAHVDTARLRAVALLDAVVNNADRKGGHLLLGTDGGVAGVDHGLTFNTQDKLRTVLWGWAGDDLGEADLATLEQLDTQLGKALGTRLTCHITPAEVEVTRRRVRRLLRSARMPQPSRSWPAVPWPAF